MDREYFHCPLDDGEDFISADGTPSTNCGGQDFGSRLALDVHYATAHLGSGPPVALGVGRGSLPGAPEDYARILRELGLFTAGDGPDFHGAPVPLHTGGWGMLGAAAGLGLALPQAHYVVWSQGTPIAWYYNDSTGIGWVCPLGDYFRYDRITSRHQNKIAAAVELLAGDDPGTRAASERWAQGHRRAWGVGA